MNRQERRQREATFPKCDCGNTLSLLAQTEGTSQCPTCVEQDELAKDMDFLRRLRLREEKP